MDNFFSEEELNKILALPQWLSPEQASIASPKDELIVREDIRVTDISWLQHDPSTEYIWSKIVNVAAYTNSMYFNFDLTGCYEPIQLTTYHGNREAKYDWHTDAHITDNFAPRKLSMTLTLSDPSEYEGGELQLLSNGNTVLNLECPKGRAWFFPSYALHRVNKVTKGVRRSLVLWMSGPQFK
jgi:PKHD-type hydroxylase